MYLHIKSNTNKTLSLLMTELAICLLLSISNCNAQLNSEGSVVYDTAINVTWTQDANLLGTMEADAINQYGNDNSLITSIIDANNGVINYGGDGWSFSATLSPADFNANGLGSADWWGAQAFIGYLNSIDYAGSTQWEQPTGSGYGYNVTSSMLGEVYYKELDGQINTSPFTNIQYFAYWSGTEVGCSPVFCAEIFVTQNGFSYAWSMNAQQFIWPVSAGNVVPEPETTTLLAVGLLGLCLARKKAVQA